jgi:hypothetical protein
LMRARGITVEEKEDQEGIQRAAAVRGEPQQ